MTDVENSPTGNRRKNLWLVGLKGRETSWKRERHISKLAAKVPSAKNIEFESQIRPTGKIFNLKLTESTVGKRVESVDQKNASCLFYDDSKFE